MSVILATPPDDSRCLRGRGHRGDPGGQPAQAAGERDCGQEFHSLQVGGVAFATSNRGDATEPEIGASNLNHGRTHGERTAASEASPEHFTRAG